jgi:hypothetical protein
MWAEKEHRGTLSFPLSSKVLPKCDDFAAGNLGGTIGGMATIRLPENCL